ncbi:MAG TPA: peptidoglycan-binding domain-containing protein [Burkholderiales bacterium]|nr:peptidoglycan-binding domain-containing protein [Burkholderiales bacterium]
MKLTYISAAMIGVGVFPAVFAQSDISAGSSPMMESAAPLDDRGALIPGPARTGADINTAASTQAFLNSADGVRQVQQQLAQRGYPVAVDGVMGPATRSALLNFQQRQGISATGRINSQTLGALGVGTQGTFGGSGSIGASPSVNPSGVGSTPSSIGNPSGVGSNPSSIGNPSGVGSNPSSIGNPAGVGSNPGFIGNPTGVGSNPTTGVPPSRNVGAPNPNIGGSVGGSGSVGGNINPGAMGPTGGSGVMGPSAGTGAGASGGAAAGSGGGGGGAGGGR